MKTKGLLYLLTAFLLLLIVFQQAFANNDKPVKEAAKAEINWLTIEEAEKKMAESPRKVFIDVYTDWCGWCKKMDKNTFADNDVAAYVNEHYYAVKLNAEAKETINVKGTQYSPAQLAQSFRVNSYPTVVFIDETFSYVTPVPGYQDAKNFKKILQKFNEAPAQ